MTPLIFNGPMTDDRVLDLNTQPYRVLAEGDSWYSLGSIPAANLLMGLDFPRPVGVLNLADPGDQLIGMLRRFETVGGGLYDWLSLRGAAPWHAILLSAGGNDLIAAVPTLLHGAARSGTDPANWINGQALANLLDFIEAGYRRLAAIRDASPHSSQAPIVAHCYDYPMPGYKPATVFGLPMFGPWLMPALDAALVPNVMWPPIVRYLIDALAERLLSLRIERFEVVDTRGTLLPGWEDDGGDWENEIHPGRRGYEKLGAVVGARVWQLVEASA